VIIYVVEKSVQISVFLLAQPAGKSVSDSNY